MPANAEPVEIVVCLGSSCFARGNSQHLATIKDYIQNHSLNATVRLSGQLCQDMCKRGPNLIIAGEIHHEVTPAALRELLRHLSPALKDDHGTP